MCVSCIAWTLVHSLALSLALAHSTHSLVRLPFSTCMEASKHVEMMVVVAAAATAAVVVLLFGMFSFANLV